MPDGLALDLSKIDPPIWQVMIHDTVYGPYTLGQLQGFITEGRVGLHTQIAEGDGARFVSAETITQLQPALRASLKSVTTDTERHDAPQNYLVVVHFSGEEDIDLARLLNPFGQFGEAMPGVFLLSSTAPISRVQKALQAGVGTQDKVLIVNATANRLGWFNLGPDADIHLRSHWDTKGG